MKKHTLQDGFHFYEFNDIHDLVESLKTRYRSLSTKGIASLAKLLQLTPRDVRTLLNDLGAPRTLTIHEMVGRTGLWGQTILEVREPRRDPRGSPGRLYKVKDPQGVVSLEFVYNVNRNDSCWK